jgi:S-DNA-T family DNA segregation ATPase FtsK/SpoIIIE
VQLTVTVVSPAAGRRADVLIDAAPETPVAQLAAELDRLVHAGPGSRVPALFVGGHRVPGDLRLADAPVRDGCVVSLGDPAGCPRPEPAGVAELRVASGPGAGAVYRLGFGTADIGGPAAGAGRPEIVIEDPAIPSLVLRVIIGRGGGQVAPYDDADVLLDRQPLDQAAYWHPGQQVAVGDTLLDLVPYQPPDAALRPAEDGAGLEFNRPPRLLPPDGAMRFQLPNPPGKPERRPVPVLMAVVPAHHRRPLRLARLRADRDANRRSRRS